MVCFFQSHQLTSNEFFNSDPIEGSENSQYAKSFQSFLYQCGFHLLDITPCADGRLAHAISYALRIPFSSVRRRSHAGALFDIEKQLIVGLKLNIVDIESQLRILQLSQPDI